MSSFIRPIIGLVIVWVAAASSFYPSFAQDRGTSQLVFGRISLKPDEALHDLKAMNSYLKKALRNGQQMTFREIVVPTLDEMAQLMKQGKVDLISETPFGAVVLEKKVGAKIILHEWKKGVSSYSSMIVAHKDSGISQLEDLRGKALAFEDPGSTTGFLLPFAELTAKGFKLVKLPNRGDRPASDAVGFVFSGHEINAASIVARQIVDAAAISDMNWYDEQEVPPGFRKRLLVLYETDPIPRSTVLVRSGMSSALREELVSIFRSMHQSEEGLNAMAVYHSVKKFDLPNEEFMRQMERIRKLYPLVEGQLQ